MINRRLDSFCRFNKKEERIFGEAGIIYVRDLASLTEKELLEIKGVGKCTVDHIRNLLVEIGFDIKSDKNDSVKDYMDFKDRLSLVKNAAPNYYMPGIDYYIEWEHEPLQFYVIGIYKNDIVKIVIEQVFDFNNWELSIEYAIRNINSKFKKIIRG